MTTVSWKTRLRRRCMIASCRLIGINVSLHSLLSLLRLDILHSFFDANCAHKYSRFTACQSHSSRKHGSQHHPDEYHRMAVNSGPLFTKSNKALWDIFLLTYRKLHRVRLAKVIVKNILPRFLWFNVYI